MKNGQTKPGYNLQIATEHQFITDFALYANPTDTLTMPSFLESFNSRYGHYAKTTVADSGYGSEENYLFMKPLQRAHPPASLPPPPQRLHTAHPLSRHGS